MSARKSKNAASASPNPLIGLDILSNQSVNESNVNEGDVAMSPALESPVANPLEAFTDALTPKVAVSYLRVSTRDQARRGGGDDEGFSIPAQREANRRKASSMGAMIVKEFVDRGASARSANRPELQRMLEYLEDHDVDYVIVHKIDRLARNRADDVEIMKSLEASSVRLVSTTESIDQTPSGILLHGIMSSIAEFYSRNLAAEVAKGMSQKVRSGGTVGRVPLGYRNHRTVDAEGREIRTVIVDAERAPLVREAFTLYASGDWTVVSLADYLAGRGLTTVPSPRLPSKPITDGHLHKILINPYYKGLTKYQGVHYPGRHEALVDEVTWQRVQDVLATHLNGERTRKHPHFLKSTVYCGQCGERLMVQNSRSKTGDVYPYFYCTGRHAKRTVCTQRSVLIYEVEKKIEDHYRRIQLDPILRAGIEELVRDQFQIAQTRMEKTRADLKREKDKFERQREKLMEAHYAGAIPVDLLGREQERISRSLREIEVRMSATWTEFETIEENLARALDLAGDCGAAYEEAPDHIKRMFNQAFFEKIFVVQIDESLAGVEIDAKLREPFDVLLGDELRAASNSSTAEMRTKKPADKTANGLSSTTSRTPLQVKGLSNALMVALSTCDTEKWSTLKTWAGSAANTRRDSPISSFDYESSVPIRQLRSETRALCQTQRRLSEADVTRIRQRYEDGATVYEIGAEFRVDRRTVAERLKKSGVSLRGRSPSEDAIVAMIALHDSGLSMFEIGKKLGFCYNTVRTHLSSASNALTEQRREG